MMRTPHARHAAGRLVAAAVVGASVLLATAVPSFADDAVSGRIDHVESGDEQIQVLYSVPGLPADVNPDLDTVRVSYGGTPIPATAKASSDKATVNRTSVLTIDVSNSMKGDAFEAAKAAALTYIDTAPEDVYIGLVTFASDVDTVQTPTQDHDALREAIAGLELSPETALYDGVIQSLEVAGDTGSRSILLLSDGKDSTDTDVADVIAAADDSGVRIDAVGLNQEITPESELNQIVVATDGTVTSTSDPAALKALFEAEANDLAKQIVVTFDRPSSDIDEGTLAVSVSADGSEYTDQAFIALPTSEATTAATPTYESDTSRFVLGGPWLIGGVVLLFGGLALLLHFAFGSVSRKEANPMQRQLSLYTVHGMRRTEPAPTQSEGVDLKQTAVALADHLVVRRDLEDKIARKLDASGLKLKPAEWLLLHAGIFIGSGLVAFLLFGGKPLLMLLGLIAGAILPWFYLSFKATRRIKKFNSQLPETLSIIAGGLQAGLSLSQAVDTVVREGTEPITSEFSRAIVEQRLGVDIEDSLETVAERMDCIDFAWVVMAIRIQREVGGNLAELLLNVAATLREREYLRRQVSVLSAEGRLSAYILGGLPPFFVLYLSLTQPEYVAPLFNTTLGMIMCGLGLTMMTVGIFWMKKAVKVEV
jgi:tight adherence protein B